jgi:excisionase family DNA binding protein
MPSVYALSDPRTDEIRYVGIAQDIYQRYAQHLSQIPSSNEKKEAWISELRAAGIVPRLIVFEANVSKTIIYEREAYWIQYYLARGEKLTNIIYGEAVALNQGLLTLQQAARKVAKSEKSLRRWIQSGKLRASKSGGCYLINPDDLDAVLSYSSPEWQMKEQLADNKSD